MAQNESGGFESYDFSADEGWLKIERNLEIPGHLSVEKKEKAIKKKQARYYKQSIDPEFDINAVLTTPPPAADQSPNEKPKVDETKSDETPPEQTSSSSNQEPNQQAQPDQPQPSSSSSEQKHADQPQSEPQAQPQAQPQAPPQASGRKILGYSPSRFYQIFMNYMKLIVYSISVICAVFYLLPIFGSSHVFFANALKAFALAHVLELLRSHPPYPLGQLKTANYWKNVAQNENSQLMMLNFLLMFSNPMLLCLGPGLCRGVVFLSQSYDAVLGQRLKSVHGFVAPYLRKVSSQAGELYNFSCQLEVYVGIYFIILLFTPARNLLILLFYWQFLRMRFIQSYGIRMAFQAIRISMDRVFHHPRCPQAIQNIWQKIVNFLYSFVDPAQLQQMAQQQQNSKCSIM